MDRNAQAVASLSADLLSKIRGFSKRKSRRAGERSVLALAHRATLVARNTKEFSRLRDLTIVDWYD